MLRLRTLQYGFLAGACSITLLGAGCASTPLGQSDTVEGSFIRAAQTWDLNHDGKVTCDEWQAYALSLFKEVDTNHDGKLTRDEFAKLQNIDHLFDAANFDYYDVNKRGYITQADFVERPNPAFTLLDKDKTCVLSSYQLRAASAGEDIKKRENPGIPGSR